MQEFRSDVDKRFDKVDSDIQRVFAALDAISKRQEISDDERLVMGHQLERLDRWTHKPADKIGYKLST